MDVLQFGGFLGAVLGGLLLIVGRYNPSPEDIAENKKQKLQKKRAQPDEEMSSALVASVGVSNTLAKTVEGMAEQLAMLKETNTRQQEAIDELKVRDSEREKETAEMKKKVQQLEAQSAEQQVTIDRQARMIAILRQKLQALGIEISEEELEKMAEEEIANENAT